MSYNYQYIPQEGTNMPRDLVEDFIGGAGDNATAFAIAAAWLMFKHNIHTLHITREEWEEYLTVVRADSELVSITWPNDDLLIERITRSEANNRVLNDLFGDNNN